MADQPGSDDGQAAVAAQPGSGDSSQRANAPEPNCAGAQEGAECWKETANQPGCYVWDDYLQPSQTVEWSGSCPGGIADGQGTMTWSSDKGPREYSGTLSDGKLQGRAVVRYPDGGVQGGSYVNGKRHGRWLSYGRDSDGNEYAREATFTNGERQQDWEGYSGDACEDNCKIIDVSPGGDLGEAINRARRLTNDPIRARRYENDDGTEGYGVYNVQCLNDCQTTSQRAKAEYIRRVKAELGIN